MLSGPLHRELIAMRTFLRALSLWPTPSRFPTITIYTPMGCTSFRSRWYLSMYIYTANWYLTQLLIWIETTTTRSSLQLMPRCSLPRFCGNKVAAYSQREVCLVLYLLHLLMIGEIESVPATRMQAQPRPLRYWLPGRTPSAASRNGVLNRLWSRLHCSAHQPAVSRGQLPTIGEEKKIIDATYSDL